MRVIALAWAETIEDVLGDVYSVTLVVTESVHSGIEEELKARGCGFVTYHGDAITGKLAPRLYWHAMYNGRVQREIRR